MLVYPAEWQRQSSILLAWPHKDSDWSTNLEAVESVYIQLVAAITTCQKALIICRDDCHRLSIQRLLKSRNIDLGRLCFFQLPYNDTWTRDYGPISILKNGEIHLLDFHFNGWGNKFSHELDNKVNRELSRLAAWPKDKMQGLDLILEGGSIDTNGQGILMTTSSCLLNQNRNKGADKQTIEQYLSNTLGVNKILWLNHGYLEGDDTDGHIDTLARFCDEHTIAYMSCRDEHDPQYIELKKMQAELHTFRDHEGKPFRLVPVPLPPAIYDQKNKRLPASYVNFLFTKKGVLVPVYGDKTADSLALKQLQKAMPDRKLIEIDCSALIVQHGSLHCITMQIADGN